MHCFCCDLDIGDSGWDSKTDRHYCSVCIEPANDEAVRILEAKGIHKPNDDQDFKDFGFSTEVFVQDEELIEVPEIKRFDENRDYLGWQDVTADGEVLNSDED